jgi:hypothetical protein
MLATAGRARPALRRALLRAAEEHPMRHREHHRTQRTGWLRAAVLGANDGIVSTASLDPRRGVGRRRADPGDRDC